MAIRLSSGNRHPSHTHEIRPTAARTLEAVFAMLAGEIEDRRVLDLYAGVGSYGILALRQGASYAVFVDRAHEAERRLKRALAQFRLTERAHFFREEVGHFLNRSDRWSEPFDLIFADPPYDLELPGATIERVLDGGFLARGGVLVFEHSKRVAPPAFPVLELRKSRVFGETTISIWDHS